MEQKESNAIKPEYIDIGSRLRQFRIAFVHQKQTTAAEVLQEKQGVLSKMENARVEVGVKLIMALVKNYHLNVNWLVTGEGEMRIKALNKPLSAQDLNTIKGDIASVSEGLRLLQFNYIALSKLIKEKLGGFETDMAILKSQSVH